MCVWAIPCPCRCVPTYYISIAVQIVSHLEQRKKSRSDFKEEHFWTLLLLGTKWFSRGFLLHFSPSAEIA